MTNPLTPTTKVPVSWGSPRFFTRTVGPFEITDAFFPPHAVLESHSHDRTVIALTMSGSLESRLGGGVVLGRPDDVWTEPAGDPHSNRVSADGAHVLVLQPDPTDDSLMESCRGLLEGVHHFRHGEMVHWARRMIPELGVAAGPNALMVEGLALQIMASGTRQASPSLRGSPRVAAALTIIHDCFREPLTVKGIANEVDLHPTYLARAFKERTGVSVGRYVRRLRLDWAREQLRSTEVPVGLIAIRARFSDQSHFTREFKKHTGTTPAKYRAEHARN